jgi:hypothetical protein
MVISRVENTFLERYDRRGVFATMEAEPAQESKNKRRALACVLTGVKNQPACRINELRRIGGT